MLFIETAEKLKQSAAKYKAANAAKSHLQQARQRSDQLQKLRASVRRIRSAADLLRGRHLQSSTIPLLADGVANTVAKLAPLVGTADGLSGTEAGPHFNVLNRNGSAALPKMEEELLQLWRSFMDERVGKYDASVLADWEHIPDFKQVAQSIREIQKKISDLRNHLPGDDDDFSRVHELAERLKDSWKQVDAPPAVLKFLRAASSPAGAPLLMLEDDVRDWIRERKQEGSFTVRTSQHSYGR